MATKKVAKKKVVLRFKPTPRTALRQRRTIAMLKEIVAVIRAEPRRYNQGAWMRNYKAMGHSAEDVAKNQTLPPCGTMACVAGWAVALNRPAGQTPAQLCRQFTAERTFFEEARKLLKLTPVQANCLFNGAAALRIWIQNSEAGDMPEVGTAAYAELGVRHIDAFLRTDLGYKGPKL